MAAARRGLPAVVDHMPVHGLMEAARRPELRAKLNSFDIVAPDGQPVRWALNLLHQDVQLVDRVYGPELMLRICRRAAEQGIGVYLYGSQPHVVERLREGGRLVYVGAGSSGRQAAADAAECEATFSTAFGQVVAVFAGEDEAAEDDEEAGASAVRQLGVGTAGEIRVD